MLLQFAERMKRKEKKKITDDKENQVYGVGEEESRYTTFRPNSNIISIIATFRRGR